MAVMELGMNHAGEIRRLVAIAEPDLRVWTNVGDAHLGFFASPDAIADAKAEILEGAAEDDVLVANADDARVMSRVSGFAGRTLTFGLAREAAVRAHEVEDLGLRGTRARVTTPAGEIRLESPLLGRGNLSNVLAATAVAVECGIAPGEIEPRVRTLRPAERRGVVHRLRDDVTVIDDSYNSSPSALRAALEVLSQETPRGRRIAVLGEMLELGDHAIAMHEACGRLAAASGIQLLFAVGGAGARALAGAGIDGGLPAASVTYFETSEQAAREIPPAVRGGDLLLVKGSRGIRTDLVTDALMAALA
jgi:UDP-N-acetylmuramoyl-tripeptide--D-alanyl-D-alanine ligase